MVTFPHEFFENKNGILHIDGVSSETLVQEFGSPLYVLTERRIRNNFRKIYSVLSVRHDKIRVYYSAKANSSLSVLKILESEDAYLDAVSIGEVFLATQAGFQPERILFTGTSVRNDELEYLLDWDVCINIDSTSQLKRLLKIRVPRSLSVRVNPEIGAGHHAHVITAGRDSKFGIWEEDVLEAYKIAKESGVETFGIHMHIGSGILTVEPFLLAEKKLLDIAGKVRREMGIDFEFIDIGGGLGVPYKPEESPLNVDLFAEKTLQIFKEKVKEYDLGDPFFCVEPGRYIVCDAGILLTMVNTLKKTPFRNFIGVDAGFNILIRPAMYGSYHPIVVANKLNDPEEEKYDIAGPLCESGDILARDRMLPKVEEGDILAILNAGAYGFVMSSNYNSRPRCPEVLVKSGRYALIREKETFKDLLEGQKIAPWLK
ncbi:MAG: diaminopimelate decarboxylase [Nitrososphaerota archaeon]|nr:diaminopimelate decarboxylase [Candidatus Bathyarchaeota archaeon]MDW8048308.1 diaminopimelate decarboxylase [Nitrososphaerota archaeon]